MNPINNLSSAPSANISEEIRATRTNIDKLENWTDKTWEEIHRLSHFHEMNNCDIIQELWKLYHLSVTRLHQGKITVINQTQETVNYFLYHPPYHNSIRIHDFYLAVKLAQTYFLTHRKSDVDTAYIKPYTNSRINLAKLDDLTSDEIFVASIQFILSEFTISKKEEERLDKFTKLSGNPRTSTTYLIKFLNNGIIKSLNLKDKTDLQSIVQRLHLGLALTKNIEAKMLQWEKAHKITENKIRKEKTALLAEKFRQLLSQMTVHDCLIFSIPGKDGELIYKIKKLDEKGLLLYLVEKNGSFGPSQTEYFSKFLCKKIPNSLISCFFKLHNENIAIYREQILEKFVFPVMDNEKKMLKKSTGKEYEFNQTICKAKEEYKADLDKELEILKKENLIELKKNDIDLFKSTYLPLIFNLQIGNGIAFHSGYYGTNNEAGHAIIFEIERQQNSYYCFRIINTGDGTCSTLTNHLENGIMKFFSPEKKPQTQIVYSFPNRKLEDFVSDKLIIEYFNCSNNRPQEIYNTFKGFLGEYKMSLSSHGQKFGTCSISSTWG